MNVFRTIRNRSHHRYAAYQGNTDSLLWRLADVTYRTWDLGFTAFGGPPVHFQIWRRRFVEAKGGSAWVDEQTVSFFVMAKRGPWEGWRLRSAWILFSLRGYCVVFALVFLLFSFFFWDFFG